MPDANVLRAEFEEMIRKDLLGPVGGAEEVLNARERVRDRYLTGMLAPHGTLGVDAERADGAGVDGDDTAQEADIEDRTAASPALFPSSYGTTFATTPDVPSLRVKVWWGRYLKEEREPDQVPEPIGELASPPAQPGGAAARPLTQRVWQRYQVNGSCEVGLDEATIGPISPVPEQPEVVIRGRVTSSGGAKLVTLFLSNEQENPALNRDSAWLFQAGFAVSAPGGEHPDGAPVFIGRREAVANGDGFAGSWDPAGELQHLEMLYRDQVEFAVGHGTAVHAEIAGEGTDAADPTRAIRISTAAMPYYEVPQTEAPSPEDDPEMAGVELDMSVLASLDSASLRTALEPLVRAYESWLDRQEARIGDPATRLAEHEDAARRAIGTARDVASRIRAGIELIATDDDAADAFRFANESMWYQRIRTTATQVVRDDPERSFDEVLTEVDVPSNRSWRPFQLAFVLLNLPSLTQPTHPERLGSDALADLLFFPTGGGKTEAYLGLCAYTFAIRRLQGTVGGRSGEGGVAVLMRYTLRLLTSQQFQRAAALVCACEVIRRRKVAEDARWGETPFRIGLWVGSSLTPNRNRDAQQAIESARTSGRTWGAQPVQLTSCPWCGRALDPGRDAVSDHDTWRTLLYCGDPHGSCDFSQAKAPGEGIPVLTVDEEMYRLLPALIIATVDKFAQLPMRGELHVLFGNVGRRCTRHGYRSPDLDRVPGREERDSHRATGSLPKAETVDCDPLRPPDLIIQDELHLISGPLGTLTGLYETAIDDLASWEVDGVSVRPKVVASTATVRRAADQVHAIFWRKLSVFPPPVLDAGDSFFARVSKEKPGRRYIGICAPGTRLKQVETRVFVAALAAAQVLYERHGALADPWMTLVGYFGSLRELGGMKRMVDDDVRSRLRKAERRGLAKRSLYNVSELTSRVASTEIRKVLDELGYRFDPDAAEDAPHPVDIVLATNMISVGVDVPRLGLMVCVGQPKATAEYIQATSRVGRSAEGPGLVLTIYNWARPRDLSHYETFEHYHATFYRHVEALSVTPFAARALDRGLSAVWVSMLRHAVHSWNPNHGAHRFDKTHERVEKAIEVIAQRAEEVSGGAGAGGLVRAALRQRTDDWVREQRTKAQGGGVLGYLDDTKGVVGLLEAPSLGRWPLWAVPNSLRETEPNVNLIIQEADPSLRDRAGFVLGAGEPADEHETAEDVAEDEDAEG